MFKACWSRLNSSFSYLTDIISSDTGETLLNESSKFALNVYTYSYGIDGLIFNEESGYKQTVEGF